jgi:hypothetical protein
MPWLFCVFFALSSRWSRRDCRRDRLPTEHQVFVILDSAMTNIDIKLLEVFAEKLRTQCLPSCPEYTCSAHVYLVPRSFICPLAIMRMSSMPQDAHTTKIPEARHGSRASRTAQPRHCIRLCLNADLLLEARLTVFDWCRGGNTVGPFAHLPQYAAPIYDAFVRGIAAFDIANLA